MRTCCICNTHWKESKNENKIKNETLIYGCTKCQKGHAMSENKQHYYKHGELEE